jgi:hypothetical protein
VPCIFFTFFFMFTALPSQRTGEVEVRQQQLHTLCVGKQTLTCSSIRMVKRWTGELAVAISDELGVKPLVAPRLRVEQVVTMGGDETVAQLHRLIERAVCSEHLRQAADTPFQEYSSHITAISSRPCHQRPPIIPEYVLAVADDGVYSALSLTSAHIVTVCLEYECSIEAAPQHSRWIGGQ